VPTGMPFSVPDTSSDVHPGAVSEEAAGLDRSEHLAVGLSGPHGLRGAADAAATAAYVTPPSGNSSCRPPEAAFSPVALVEVAGSGTDPAPGAGAPRGRLRRVARASQLVGLAFAPELI
jgi:hypothetical protein